MKYTQDVIAWFEIPALDFDRAVRFYRNAVSLNIQVIELNGQKHGIIHNRYSTPKGTIVESEKSNDGKGPVLFFRAGSDISLMLESITKNGGTIVTPKTLIRNMSPDGTSRIPLNLIDHRLGYFTTFLDTEGNLAALYSNS